MATAHLRVAAEPAEMRRPPLKQTHPRKPPIALRPLHRMWRRTIDDVAVVPVDLPVRQLPAALAGLVACQISDFHVDREEDLARLEKAVETINRQHPDFVFLTGGYFSGPDTMRRYIDGVRPALANLTPKLSVFSIPGNYDHWSSFGMISEALRASGARSFANQHARLTF